jgi:hypothetical protein
MQNLFFSGLKELYTSYEYYIRFRESQDLLDKCVGHRFSKILTKVGCLCVYRGGWANGRAYSLHPQINEHLTLKFIYKRVHFSLFNAL